MESHELLLLGAPILDQSMEEVLMSKLEDLNRMAERLLTVDSHDALFLLKSCFSIPKLTYFIRSAPTFKAMDVLKLYDEKIKQTLQSILNVELKENAWHQSSLPVKRGGLGIRLASDLALPAFLSSAHGARAGMEKLLPSAVSDQPYEDIATATDKWSELVNHNAEQPQNPSVQAAWDEPVVTCKYQQLLQDEDNPSEKARLLAVASEHSSDWLNALPVPAIGLKLDNVSLRIACGIRLGSNICQPYKCTCGSLVDSTGRHGLSCKNAKGTFPRHQNVNSIIKRALGSAQATSILEPAGLARSDGKRPDGLTLYPWSQGRCLVWDYTCRDTLAPSNVDANSHEAGRSAVKAEKDKFSHYLELSTTYIVTPIAMETLGSWGPIGLKFIKEIGSRIEQQTGEKRATSFLFQAISMAVQRGNVASIRGSVPNSKTLDELYYL